VQPNLKNKIMKKFFLLASLIMGLMVTVNAQSSTLKDYLGKYAFPEGSPVDVVTLTLEDTVLVSNTSMGSTPLERKGLDTFYLAAYDASVIFKRDASNAVVSVTIAVQGMELIGKKLPTTTAYKKEEFYNELWASHCE
jgi:hypothetical protein